MPRPPLTRTICRRPGVTRYKPSGVPARLLQEVVLGYDEIEALRLADLEGLYQEQAAEQMGISRPTFGRLVAEARRKVADALLHGHALAFEGGPFALAPGPWHRCGGCGQEWQAPASGETARPCNACGSDDVAATPPTSSPHLESRPQGRGGGGGRQGSGAGGGRRRWGRGQGPSGNRGS